jgi:hypothetical protein
MKFLHSLLGLALIVPVVACSPEDSDSPPYVVAEETYQTENGYFAISFTGTNGQSFDKELLGPTDLAIAIDVGPDPGPGGPGTVGGKPFTPPLKLALGPARPWDGPGGPQTITSVPTPVTPDGFEWITTLSAGPGVWVQPVTISDAVGHSDTIELAFKISAK